MSNLLSNRVLNGKLKPNRDDLFYPFQQFFDSFYDNLYSDLSPDSLKSKSGFPRWDIYQTKENWVVEIAVTGCEADDLSVEIVPSDSAHKRILKVSGRVSSSNQLGDSITYSVRELRRSSFERCTYLPNEIKGDPEATIKDGILKLSWKLPEFSKKEEPKKIEIKKK